MTRKISLITAVAVAALTVGVPTAFGEGRLAGSQEPALATPDPMIEDGFAQAVAASLALQSTATYRDAHERATSMKGIESKGTTYRDAFERGVASGQLDLSTFRNAFDRAGNQSQGLQSSVSYRDAHERAMPVAAPAQVPAIDAGRNIEWPQVGIGFGVGVLLAVGLLLAVRATRIRPLAH